MSKSEMYANEVRAVKRKQYNWCNCQALGLTYAVGCVAPEEQKSRENRHWDQQSSGFP